MFTEEQIKPWSKIILDYLIKNDQSLDKLYSKYSTKKFMKASFYVKDWVIKYGRQLQLQLQPLSSKSS